MYNIKNNHNQIKKCSCKRITIYESDSTLIRDCLQKAWTECWWESLGSGTEKWLDKFSITYYTTHINDRNKYFY